MSIFSRGEIEGRLGRFRSTFGDCDVGITFSFTNSYYLSGVPVIPWGRPTITMVPREGDPALVLAIGEKTRALDHSPITDIRTYADNNGPSVAEALELVAGFLEERGLKRIGFDAVHTPVATLEKLKARVPGLEFHDLSEAIESIRLVNSDEELALIRTATAIADHGMETFISEAAIGRPEVVLSGCASLAMAKFAAENFPDAEVRTHCYSQQGVRSLQPHTAANGDPLRPGQLMCVVVEVQVWHYLAAVERTLALGDLSTAQAGLYDAIVAAEKAAIEAVGPGIPCCDVDRAGRAVFEEVGFSEFLCGTGLTRGLVSEWEGRIDKGNLRIYNETPLMPGMVVTVEPFAASPEIGAPRHCDMVLVTETGREIISRARAGIIRID
jgi:Xaa-Pro aminopeptidase